MVENNVGIVASVRIDCHIGNVVDSLCSNPLYQEMVVRRRFEENENNGFNKRTRVQVRQNNHQKQSDRRTFA